MGTAATPPAPLSARLRDGFVAFVSAPASPRPLGVLRIGLASVLLVQALLIAPNVLELFGQRGVMQWALAEELLADGVPRIRWVAEWLAPLGVSDVAAVRGTFLLYVAGLSALLLGWHTRVAAVVTWLTHLVLIMSVRGSVYGVDDFAHIALFYCVFFPIGGWGSLDVAAGRASPEPSAGARLALRVLQIHLCFIYTSSGIEKALTPPYQWLDGEAIWRTFVLPDYRMFFDLTWTAAFPWAVKLMAWGTLVLEIGYGVFVWPRATRKLWAWSTIAMHVGIALFMGLVSFAAFMIVLTFSAWLVSAEPRASAPLSPAPGK